MNTDEIERLIENHINTEAVEVRSDDGTHFAALVVSPDFDGLRPLQRHQLVYAALGSRVGREIHALSIQASTPEEWRRDSSAGRDQEAPGRG
jgi:acid stress-induced BolA-like protein IbaG/YrbA